MMRRILFAPVLMALIFCYFVTNASADSLRYTITDLGALPAPISLSKSPPVGSTQIVAEDYYVGRTTANAINDQGQIVGQSSAQAFLWQDGKMIGLGALPRDNAVPEENMSVADAINAQGQIVGGSGGFWPIVMSGLYNCKAFIYSHSRIKPLTTDKDAASFEPFALMHMERSSGCTSTALVIGRMAN